jgi:hypothetical protein
MTFVLILTRNQPTNRPALLACIFDAMAQKMGMDSLQVTPESQANARQVLTFHSLRLLSLESQSISIDHLQAQLATHEP